MRRAGNAVIGPGGQLQVLMRMPVMTQLQCEIELNRACLLTYVAPAAAAVPHRNNSVARSGLAWRHDVLAGAGPASLVNSVLYPGRTGGQLNFTSIVHMPGGGQKFTVGVLGHR